jgi:hypothetical protein
MSNRHHRFFIRASSQSLVIGFVKVCLAALVILAAVRLSYDWRSNGVAAQMSVAAARPLPPPAAEPMPLREVLGYTPAPTVKTVAFNPGLRDSGDYRRRQMLEMWARTGAIQYDASGIGILRPHLDKKTRLMIHDVAGKLGLMVR